MNFTEVRIKLFYESKKSFQSRPESHQSHRSVGRNNDQIFFSFNLTFRKLLSVSLKRDSKKSQIGHLPSSGEINLRNRFYADEDISQNQMPEVTKTVKMENLVENSVFLSNSL